MTIFGVALLAICALAATPVDAVAAEIRDAPGAPVMIEVPPGAYDMGSPTSQPGHQPNEAPQRRVTIGYDLAVGKYDVTRDQFAAFVRDTGYAGDGPGGCDVRDAAGHWSRDPAADWRRPGIAQTGADPVVCVSYYDANAYAAWLTGRTGRVYRLPSEAEWEYAARAGAVTTYGWGDDLGRGRANCDGCGSRWDSLGTSPTGSFPANAFGLHDMAGDAWQWTLDCYADDRSDAPTDGSPSSSGDCAARTIRGGAWNLGPRVVRLAFRHGDAAALRNYNIGFRVVRLP